MQLWQGRFTKAVDSRVNDFNSSIRFDRRMAAQDITGSMAHAAMLTGQGIISEADGAAIQAGLEGILADLESGALAIDPAAEDIHTFVEAELTKRIGEPGKRLHTGRSRNDQVAVDLRLFLRDAAGTLNEKMAALCDALLKQAAAHAADVMPGYTHLQRAQPVTFGHHLLAYVQMLLRDMDRLADWKKRMNVCPLGSGALAGTTYPIDRHATAAALGFDGPCENSLDGVSDRDFCIELAAVIATCMVHLSRLSEEIILWCSWEFRFIELDDAFTTGSSIMPQKKNPDVAELVRGKTGRVYGDLITLLTMMKGLPLAYNKDMQEDKEALFDAIDTAEECLPVVAAMVHTLSVRRPNMERAAAGGFINATDCADYLVKKGMPFREAYLIVGRLVSQCIRAGETLDTLSLKDFKAVSKVFDEDVYQALELRTCVNGRKVCGGPAADSVRVQIGHIREFVETRRHG